MYILIVARDFPKDSNPLRGIFEFDQAKALQSFGHKVVYISLDLRSIRRTRKLGKYWIKKEGVEILNISAPLGRLPQQIKYFIGKQLLKFILKEVLTKHGKPEIIHAHFSGIGLMASVLKEKFNIPLVITEHSSKITKQTPTNRQEKVGKYTYSKADSILAVSSLLANNLKLHWNVNAEIIHNIVDTKSFKFNETRKTKNFIFISIGHLIPRKGFDFLIEAFKKADFNQSIRLRIIGEGPEHNKLQKQIDTSGLNTQIELMGFLNRNKISKVMQECDAFVLASRGETFGVVYIEAMLTGLPVIATSCGGPEDFVNSENGLLVPVNDLSALTKALKSMHQSIDKYDRKAISINCRNNFCPAKIAAQLTDIYQNTLDKNLK